MKKMEMVKMMLEYREMGLENIKTELEWHRRSLNEAVERGHYNEAAQFGEKIARAGYEIEAIEKELREFKNMLEELEEG